MYAQKNRQLYLAVVLIFFFISCKNHSAVKDKQVVNNPAIMDEYVQKNIKALIAAADNDKSKIDDSTQLKFLPVVKKYFEQNDYAPIWTSAEKWKQPADSLIGYLQNAAMDGLFSEDYGFSKILSYKKILDADSVKRSDAVLWAKVEITFTDAFVHLVQDLKQGRMQPDSLSFRNNETLYKEVFFSTMDKLKAGASFSSIINALQPNHTDYLLLKSGIRKFVDSMDNKTYTYVEYPYKDSISFIKRLQKRFIESGLANNNISFPDSAQLASEIKKYQVNKGIKADGKVSASLVKMLNTTDKEKFKRIAVTLDRYKQLPAKMPEKYIWVNLPAFYLKVVNADTVALRSKIICGKPGTPTPIITSAITDMMIFPTWTVPSSIISKEMLPGLKRNPGYLARKGLYLLNNNGERIDPYSINWSKYSKGIPYRVQQGSGDNNALGVIKFNFNNPYAVYLHDTNQRYLFNNSMRSLSHGCVRVQEWQKLAFYLLKNDSMLAKRTDTLKANSDSLVAWVAAKERHKIDVKNKFPVFIRYFGCELVDGSIKFYDDIYNDDKAMREKYFAGK